MSILLIESTKPDAKWPRVSKKICASTLTYKEVYKITRSLSLWQSRFWDHIIRDEDDLRRHVDYTHFNPVKHGLVARPEDYAHSSYRYWLKKGYYAEGWGHSEPENLKGMDFE